MPSLMEQRGKRRMRLPITTGPSSRGGRVFLVPLLAGPSDTRRWPPPDSTIMTRRRCLVFWVQF